MVKLKPLPVFAGAVALGLFISATPAHATALVADGITYTLTETPLSATSAQFDLHASGINGASDTEMGRSGVNGVAFTTPANFSTASFVSATGGQLFTEMAGGLTSGGCDGHGAFFCFKANTAPGSSPPLAANSTFDIIFDVAISSGSLTGYVPDLKIDWVGSKNNYDLVSEAITPMAVPAPVIGHGFLVLLTVGGVLFGGKFLESLKKHRLQAA